MTIQVIVFRSTGQIYERIYCANDIIAAAILYKRCMVPESKMTWIDRTDKTQTAEIHTETLVTE